MRTTLRIVGSINVNVNGAGVGGSRPCMRRLAKSAIMSHLAYKRPPVLRDIVLGSNTIDYPKERLEILSKDEHKSIKEAYDIAFLDGTPITGSQAYVWTPRIINNVHDRVDGDDENENEHAYIVFRGTDGVEDIPTNIDVRYSDWTCGGRASKVHKGFSDQYSFVRKAILRQIERKKKHLREITVTGHSLGGALATLAASDIAYMFRDKRIHCHTFGSPRVGNEAFRKHFENVVASSWRVFNREDPVCLVPMSHRFVHVGSGVCIKDDLEVYWDVQDAPWILRLALGLWMLDYNAPIKDHDCALYIDRCLSVAGDI